MKTKKNGHMRNPLLKAGKRCQLAAGVTALIRFANRAKMSSNWHFHDFSWLLFEPSQLRSSS